MKILKNGTDLIKKDLKKMCKRNRKIYIKNLRQDLPNNFWIGSVDADTEHQSIYRKCLTNRGHSVLN